MASQSLGGAEYFVNFIEEYSDYTIVQQIKKKSEVLHAFKQFHRWFERLYSCTVKRLVCDNGGEYLACQSYLDEVGIVRVPHPPYTPELNGVAERANRTLMESACSILYHAKMPPAFWAEAVVQSADIRNRFQGPLGSPKTSYELLTGSKPLVDHLRVFGSTVWVLLPRKKRSKLDSKSVQGVLVSGLENSVCKVWFNSQSAKLAINVLIDEDTFPPYSWYDPLSSTANDFEEPMEDVPKDFESPIGEASSTQEDDPMKNTTETTEGDEESLEHLNYVPEEPSTFVEDEEGKNTTEIGTEVQVTNEPSRYPSRNRSPPDHYQPGAAHSALLN